MKEEIIQNNDGIAKQQKIDFRSKLQQRIAAAKEKEQEETPKKHRLVIMPDLSGSMNEMGNENKTRFDYLHKALENFVLQINEEDTSITSIPFPLKGRIFGPCSKKHSLLVYIESLQIDGSTPMGHSMQEAISNFSMTRAIIISDGQQTDGSLCFSILPEYVESGIPIDCIYIGPDGDEGEETLKRIAETTKGFYIKFDDLENFAAHISYLTPTNRGLLNASNAMAYLGAKEVK